MTTAPDCGNSIRPLHWSFWLSCNFHKTIAKNFNKLKYRNKCRRNSHVHDDRIINKSSTKKPSFSTVKILSLALNSAEPNVDDSLAKNENSGCSISLVEMPRTTLPTSEQKLTHPSLCFLDLLDLLTVKVVHKLSHVRHIVDDHLGS